jgi:hypothetical protein
MDHFERLGSLPTNRAFLQRHIPYRLRASLLEPWGCRPGDYLPDQEPAGEERRGVDRLDRFVVFPYLPSSLGDSQR